MNSELNSGGLVDGEFARQANAQLPIFPPPRDFPMVISKDGKVVSRYGDDFIDYSIYAGTIKKISFVNGSRSKIYLDDHHFELLRIFVAYFQFIYKRRLSPSTIISYCSDLKKVMGFCIEHSVRFEQLHRFPLVVEKLSLWLEQLRKKCADNICMLLMDCYLNREVIGFYALDKSSLAIVMAFLKRGRSSVQTACIPERIWLYQINRIEYFLDKFLEKRSVFVRLYLKLLNGYLKNLGSIENACRSGTVGNRSPLNAEGSKNLVRYGSFSELARSYGVLEVISELVYGAVDYDISRYAGAMPFGRYFNSINFIAQVFLINFSGMRISEAASLRVNCFESDQSLGGGGVHFLRGETKKTQTDFNALWVTSPVAEKAVKVLTVISRLRVRVMKLDSRIKISDEDFENPYLVVYGVEPWLSSKKAEAERDINIRSWLSYNQWSERCPGLFELDEIKITDADLAEAIEATPDLDPEKYAVGKVWPFAYHQLRRTLNVNAARSGLVSITSSQSQMKHQYQGMSTYYGREFSGLALNKDIESEFVEEVYRQLASAAARLEGDEYFSPLKDNHKATLISFLGEKDFKKLMMAAKDGKINVRQTLLGVCLSREFCSFGSIDNIVNCGSCPDALVKKGNLPKLERFLCLTEEQLERVASGSPRHESLCKQRQVALNVIEAINVR